LCRRHQARELVDRQVGPLARAEHREEAQAGDVDRVEVLGGEQHQLVGALGGRVGRHRRQAGIGFLERRLTVAPVHGRRRPEHEARDAVAARRIEHTLRAGHVDVGEAGRLGQRRAHARQRRQMHDHLGVAFGEHALQRLAVADVALDEGEFCLAAQLGQVPFLLGAWIERIEVVVPDHVVAPRAQAFAKVRTDEPRGPGDEDDHRAQSNLAAPASRNIAGCSAPS
jgi:hypothetical protein